MAMFGGAILTPLYIQNVRGFTPLQSGLLLLPGAILMGIMSPVSGMLLDKIGIRPLAITGLLITVGTTYEFAQLTMTTSYNHVMLLYTLRMFGMSFLMMTIMTTGLNTLPRELNSHGTAASNTVRMVAGSVGTALLVTMMTTRSNVHYVHMTNSMSTFNPQFSQIVHNIVQAVAGAMGVPVSIANSMVSQLLGGMVEQRAMVSGINDAYMLATVFSAVAFVFALFLRSPIKRSGAVKVRERSARHEESPSSARRGLPTTGRQPT
jgi:Major Facilitator Superfamily